MTEERGATLTSVQRGIVTPARMRQVDSHYRPFPSLAEFLAAVTIDEEIWNEVQAQLDHLRAERDDAAMAEVIEVVTRAAAWDTGAIEGLYRTTPGATFSIARQDKGWEAHVAEQGRHAE